MNDKITGYMNSYGIFNEDKEKGEDHAKKSKI